MLDLSPIVEIVRHREATGDYGHAHFRIAEDVVEQIRKDVPGPKPMWVRAPFAKSPSEVMAQLMGIPVRVDGDLPPGGWSLVDNGTKDVIKGGVLRRDPEEKP